MTATPAASEVEQQLQRMLASTVFANAPILRRFLNYVVESWLNDNGAALKEYTLGVDVFERGSDFDPRVDTIVRTHARRLRAKLQEYYAGPGQADPLLIEVPKGHYAAAIGRRPPRAAATHAQGSENGGHGSHVHLPAPRASLVGRAAELVELRQLLSGHDVRLLTVTGAGGSGKSRLALQSAWDCADLFAGGVVFAPLAAVRDQPGLVGAVANALGVAPAGGKSLEALLEEHLQRDIAGPVLLLLDNFEQIASTAPLVGEWLDGCSSLKVLVTSRVALRIYGEHEYPLSPLQVPPRDPLPPLDELAGNPAVSLFLQRAAAVSRCLALTQDNAGTIAELCRRLDGLPLSIELVAAQAGKLTPAAMLERFSGHLDLPEQTARDLPERQRTVRRTIDWSHDLLDETMRTLLRRLSVFVGGFGLEGVEAVGNTQGDLGECAAEQMIAGLVAGSLVMPVRDGEEARFTMLETIREYGVERLAASSEAAAVRRAHAAYCLVLAEEGNGGLAAQERETWLARCDREHDNFRAAIAGMLQRGEQEWAMRMGIALFGYWERREYVVEGDRQLRTILAHCGPGANPALWVRLVNCLGAFAGIREQTGEAGDLFERALEVSTAAGDVRGRASSLNSLAVNLQFTGDLPGACHWYEQALATCRQLGDDAETAASLCNLANDNLLLGEHDVARNHLQEALALFQATGSGVQSAWCLNHLADVAMQSGDDAEAERLYRESEAMFRRLGDAWGVARSCTDLGQLAVAKDDLAQAGAWFAEALGLFQQLGHRRGVAILLEGCAQLLARRQCGPESLVMAGAAKSLRESIAVPGRASQQACLEQSLIPVWRATAPDVAKACWARGAAMPAAAAIAYALEAMRTAHEVTGS